MRWFGVAMAWALALAALHVEPLGASVAMMSTAITCLFLAAPREALRLR